MRYSDFSLYGALCILGIILISFTGYFGFWWFTILIGFSVGILIQSGWAAFILSLLIGMGGWGGTLLYQLSFLPVIRIAALIAEIIGISGSDGWIMIGVTILLGVLLCACGAWFGFALRSLISLKV